MEQNLAMMQDIERMAAVKGCKPSQLALAWVLARGEDIVPIPGTKRMKYLEENAAAVDVKLSAKEMSEIADALRAHAVAGLRYPEMAMGTLNR